MKTAGEIIEAKKNYLIPCVYHFYQHPPVIARGSMQYLYDSEGRTYTDCYAGVTVMNCGHCNPAITEPAIEQIRTLQHTTTIYLTEPTVQLAEELVDFMDCSLKKVFFVNSGSEANEGALLLAKLYTGKRRFLTFDNGLHGRTGLTMNATNIEMWRTDPFPEGEFSSLPGYEDPSMQPDETGQIPAIAAIEKLLAESGDVAAVIAEPIQGNGGIIPPHPAFFQQLSPILKKYGVLLIFDEIQSGFGRTGKKWGWQHWGVEPDIMTIAKALGNGFPISAFCTKNEIAACYTRPGASTTGGNAVSATAARAVLSYYQSEKLVEKSRDNGRFLADSLQKMVERFGFFEKLRGAGLMLGIPVLNQVGEANPALTDYLLENLKDRGFLAGKTGTGRNVLSFMPPLVIEPSDLEKLVAVLAEICETVPGEIL